MERKTEGRGRRPLPSPGIVVGLIALVAALAGTAIALPGRNTVDSGDIERNAVRGQDVKESSLGAVPNAKAVGRTKVRSFFIQVEPGGPDEELEFSGVRVSANCPGMGAFLANTSGQDAQLMVDGTALAAGEVPIFYRDADFTNGDAATLTYPDTDTEGGHTTASVILANGRATTLELAYSATDHDGSAGCNYWGRIMSG